ncbi:MAG: hypothetical protein Q9201_001879 [Fulgogasparrea decipioides]
MPSLPDKSSRSSQRASSFSRNNQETGSEGRSNGHKSRKKHDRSTENTNEERLSNAFPEELNPPPSLLSQLHTSHSSPLNASNDVSSPLLAALGSFPATEDISEPLYPEIASNDAIPSHGSPPGIRSNGFSLAGSPPSAKPQARVLSGGFSIASPTRSPPATYSKPNRRASEYQSFGGYHGSPPSGDRYKGAQSQRSPSQNPALPHHPQAHFYSAPDVDFGLPPNLRGGQRPATRGCCVFDNLDSAGAEGLRESESVLLVGLQNRLDVFNVDRGRLDRIGRLDGLRGTVIGAQLVPCPARDDPVRSLRPLVAVVVHGPQLGCRPRSHHISKDDSDDAMFDPSASMMQALEHTDNPTPPSSTPYQTTVEVYSLGKCEHIATLLRSPMIDSTAFPTTPESAGLPPDDQWQVQAHERFIVVGSAKSGEVFIFECIYDSNHASSLAFKCIGKTWTSVSQKKKRSLSTSSTESDLEDRPGSTPSRRDGVIFSLSHRWLAIVPPFANVTTTTHASVDLEYSRSKPPGLSTHTSPQVPQPTCDLDTPEQESLLNKVARDITQELMKGARWIGDQGMQAWKHYWQKPPDPNDLTGQRSPPANANLPPHVQNPLPPTHAHDDVSSRVVSQRAIVSILDLEKLSASQAAKEDIALQPVAAFALPDGCSLVSFTPNGLGLLTASAKGDVQHVWSLMRMVHGGGPAPYTDADFAERAPSVRQIARFTRLTVAKIFDVVWTGSGGERLALVTERGTVHIYDLPPSALQWPPPRRRIKPPAATAQSPKASPELAPVVPQRPASSRLGSAMDMVTGRTQPFLAAVRGRPASIGNPFSGFSGMSLTAGAGIKSGKVVAAGFNRSVGAATGTVSTIRHLGENRLTLPGPPHAVAPGRVRWLAGKNRGCMVVTGGDTVKVYRISHSANQKPGKRRPSVVGSRPVELSLADALEDSTRSQEGYGSSCPHGFWQPPSRLRLVQRVEEISLHSQAEIDTNAPYQPFHTDRRVNIFIYPDEDRSSSSDPHHLNGSTPWVFGESIATIRTSAGAAHSDEANDGTDSRQPGQIENHVSVQGNEREGQQIVITTRRRKTPKPDSNEAGGEEIFEDDCEVVDFADERV